MDGNKNFHSHRIYDSKATVSALSDRANRALRRRGVHVWEERSREKSFELASSGRSRSRDRRARHEGGEA